MKTYNSDLIYFGNVFFNTPDGYYFTGVESFEKIEEDKYISLKNNRVRETFDANSDRYLSVGYLFPLSKVLKDGERKEVTRTEIELYKLKYILTKFGDERKTKDKVFEMIKKNK